MEKDLSASAELRQLYMYLFASEVRWGTSELTLFQKATTTKKTTVRSRDMPPDALRPRYYILKYFCMRYFMNTGNGQRINVIEANYM